MSPFRLPLLCLLLLLALLCGSVEAAPPSLTSSGASRSFQVLTYHDVVEQKDQLDADAVTLETLVNHFEWLHANGYHPISVDDLLAARDNIRPLPDKPLLLSWDDAYDSFYTLVFPLLRAYGYPALLSVVGAWQETPEEAMVDYGGEPVPRSRFLSWEQIRELADSGLVEIASHSMDLHRTVQATPFGDRLPLALAPAYDPQSRRVESTADFTAKIKADLKTSSALLERHTGRKPRVLVWPYGRYTEWGIDAAREAGFPLTMSLDYGMASLDHLSAIPRSYAVLNQNAAALRHDLQHRRDMPLMRYITVSSRDLLEGDDTGQVHFSALLDRLWKLQPGNLLLSPVVREHDSSRALFINPRLELAEDRLTRICWHSARRVDTPVSLWLDNRLFPDQASPGEDAAFFEAMGRAAPCRGVVLDLPALAEELLAAGNPLSFDPLQQGFDPHRRRLTRQQLLSQEKSGRPDRLFRAMESFQRWQPALVTTLVIPPELAAGPEGDNLRLLLQFFDYLIVDLRQEPDTALTSPLLTDSKLAAFRPFLSVLLPAEPQEQLAAALLRLRELGFANRGYGDDRFLEGWPDLDKVRPFISTRSFPFIP